MSKNSQPSYSQALRELEQIISDIESEDIDVDVLAAKVKRAAFLVKLCKTRLRKAEDDLKKVITEIEADSGEGGIAAEAEDAASI